MLVPQNINGQDTAFHRCVSEFRNQRTYWAGLVFRPEEKTSLLTRKPESTIHPPSSQQIPHDTVMILVGLDEDENRLRDVFEKLAWMTSSDPIPFAELQHWILYLRQES